MEYRSEDDRRLGTPCRPMGSSKVATKGTPDLLTEDATGLQEAARLERHFLEALLDAKSRQVGRQHLEHFLDHDLPRVLINLDELLRLQLVHRLHDLLGIPPRAPVQELQQLVVHLEHVEVAVHQLVDVPDGQVADLQRVNATDIIPGCLLRNQSELHVRQASRLLAWNALLFLLGLIVMLRRGHQLLSGEEVLRAMVHGAVAADENHLWQMPSQLDQQRPGVVVQQIGVVDPHSEGAVAVVAEVFSGVLVGTSPKQTFQDDRQHLNLALDHDIHHGGADV
eukprot:scaffold1282_cov251-Pinguiococcus_pyrenoidosus.AAC.40